MKVRITLSFVAEKTKKTKVIQNFMENHILFYHFPEKTCLKKFLQHFNFSSLAAMAVTATCRRDQLAPKYFVWIGNAPAKNIEILKLKVE